jgi:spore coat protein U-like protein
MFPPLRILALAAAAGLAPLALAAGTSESAEIRVTATVINTCKITATEDISFGQLDPAAAVDVTAEGAVSFKCTRNADYTVTADNGANWDGSAGKRQMKGAGKEAMPYTLAQSSFTGKGAGFSTPIRLALRASLSGSAYRDLPADAYTDTLRISINP